MPVGDILLARVARLTPQQLADFALVEDKARRAAIRRGDHEAAAAHEAELAKLVEVNR